MSSPGRCLLSIVFSPFLNQITDIIANKKNKISFQNITIQKINKLYKIIHDLDF
jgi:hypothetical protein